MKCVEIAHDRLWKPPRFADCLDAVLAEAKTQGQCRPFKVWRGDHPNCEIEIKAAVVFDGHRYGFRFAPRPGTDFWEVLGILREKLGDPTKMEPTGECEPGAFPQFMTWFASERPSPSIDN